MAEYRLKFPDAASTDGTDGQQQHFRLLQLTPDLLARLESADASLTSLTIKGHPTDDAVLCTEDKTYALRSVVLSNTVLVLTPQQTEEGQATDLVVSDSLNEVLELVPAVPRVHRLKGLLRGLEYDGEDLDEGEGDDDEDKSGGRTQRRTFTYQQAQAEIQASEAELARAVAQRHILNLNGCLRPITPDHLLTVLSLVLNALAALSLSHTAAPLEDLAAALQDEHDVPRAVTEQVLAWFGTLDPSDGAAERKWDMDVDAVVRQIGIGILSGYKDEKLAEDVFMAKWRDAVGDTYSSACQLPLLSGNYIASNPTPASSRTAALLTFLPASELPTDPSARFADLFATRARWRADDIAPFLTDIAVDGKERDKLLLKYARAVTDSDGVWYTARLQYGG